MYFEIAFISILVLIQFYVFLLVWRKISQFRNFFPDSFSKIKIEHIKFNKQSIANEKTMYEFISNIGKATESDLENSQDEDSTDLIVVDDRIKKNHRDFYAVVKSTNAYLLKNQGSSADFNILQDICDRHLQKLESGINSLISVPLYIGLGGTFMGIIIGLMGIDFSQTSSGVALSTDSIAELLNGVVAAMVASLFGLVFTVWNMAINLKPATFKNDTDKNYYYDFLQRELLPVLTVGMAGSLNNFKSVLSQFIIKFGKNIEGYSKSASLLNDNLVKQHLVLQEINKLSLTKTATTIAEVFANLKDSAQHLETFKQYQKGLNENISKMSGVVLSLNTAINNFNDFNTNLKTISTNASVSLDFQKQFKESLEKHFPTVTDHREVWRKQADEINSDIKEVYKQLNAYFQSSTEQIQNYVSKNQNFFSDMENLKQLVKVFVENSSIQNEYYKELKSEITELRNDYRASNKSTLEMNKDLIEAIKSFNVKLSKVELFQDSKK